ncbi:MAG TPA: hypothetical protein VF595_08960, partial [Tepidisphaeraceae bacterium]
VRTLIGRPEKKAIHEAARAGHGEARRLHEITAVARRHGAKPAVVNAAFGFLRDARRPRGYVDVLTADEFTLGLLPTDAATAAAFALSRAVCPQTCGLVVA